MIKFTIDEDLLSSIDAMAKGLGTSRSALISDALEETLRYYRLRIMESQQIGGYEINTLPTHKLSETKHDAEK